MWCRWDHPAITQVIKFLLGLKSSNKAWHPVLAGLKWSHSCSEGGAMIRKWSSYHAMKSLILEIFLLICTGDLLSLAGIIEEFLQSKHEIPCTQWNQSYAYSLSVSLSREVSVVMRSWQEDSYLVTWHTHTHVVCGTPILPIDIHPILPTKIHLVSW